MHRLLRTSSLEGGPHQPGLSYQPCLRPEGRWLLVLRWAPAPPLVSHGGHPLSFPLKALKTFAGWCTRDAPVSHRSPGINGTGHTYSHATWHRAGSGCAAVHPICLWLVSARSRSTDARQSIGHRTPSHTALNAAVVVGATSINAPASPFPPPAQLQRDSRVRASGRHSPSGPRGATRCPEVHGQSRAPLGYLMPAGGGHMARGKDLFPLVWVPRVHITDIFFYKFY